MNVRQHGVALHIGSIATRWLVALSVLFVVATRAQAFDFCITTCDGGTACFDETYHYRYRVNTVHHNRLHVVIVSAVVCNGVDVESGATYHIVNGVHVNAWDIAGVGTDDYDQVNRLVLVGDRGDVLILHQTIRLTAEGPAVVRTRVQCSNPDSVWPP